MALEDIFKALEEQGEAECADIVEAARDQADSIAKEAAREADAIRAKRIELAERSVRSATAQQMNTVRLEGKKEVASVKEDAVQAVFAAALGQLGTLRGTAGYEALFRALAAEALEGVAADAEVLVDPADEKIAASVLSEMGVSAPVRSELDSAGGLVVLTDGGRIARRNTLEDRLDKARVRAQAGIAGILLS